MAAATGGRGGGGGAGRCRVLISELPWRAAMAVRHYERSFAKVRQIPPRSFLIGVSGLRNRGGRGGRGVLWAWSFLQLCSTEGTSWHMQQRPLIEIHNPVQRTHDRPQRNASARSKAAVLQAENRPGASKKSRAVYLVKTCYVLLHPLYFPIVCVCFFITYLL